MGHLTYLTLELVWALPVLALQWLVGWRTLRRSIGTLLAVVVLATVYLSCADAVAIANGIWTIHDPRTTALRLGDLPLEETLFFLLTNSMIVQTVLIAWPYINRRS